jgi:hypothetical protein
MSNHDTASKLARALNDCLIVMESSGAGDTVAAKLACEALTEAGFKVEHCTNWSRGVWRPDR